MKTRLFSTIVVVLALIIAILACVLPVENLNTIIIVSRFFEAMLPILAVGALIKYLCPGCPVKGEHNHKE